MHRTHLHPFLSFMHYSQDRSHPTSCSSSLASTFITRKSAWSRVSNLLSSLKHRPSIATAISSTGSTGSGGLSNDGNAINKCFTPVRRCYPLDHPSPPLFAIPPFSPTYCKPNEFPYSNFYIKLPTGDYMVRYRSGNREILGTEIIPGHMI